MKVRLEERTQRPEGLTWAVRREYGQGMDISSRFDALPRARKGTTTVIIVEEAVLAKLIHDATWKHSEVSDQEERRRRHPRCRERIVSGTDPTAGERSTIRLTPVGEHRLLEVALFPAEPDAGTDPA